MGEDAPKGQPIPRRTLYPDDAGSSSSSPTSGSEMTEDAGSGLGERLVDALEDSGLDLSPDGIQAYIDSIDDLLGEGDDPDDEPAASGRSMFRTGYQGPEDGPRPPPGEQRDAAADDGGGGNSESSVPDAWDPVVERFEAAPEGVRHAFLLEVVAAEPAAWQAELVETVVVRQQWGETVAEDFDAYLDQLEQVHADRVAQEEEE